MNFGKGWRTGRKNHRWLKWCLVSLKGHGLLTRVISYTSLAAMTAAHNVTPSKIRNIDTLSSISLRRLTLPFLLSGGWELIFLKTGVFIYQSLNNNYTYYSRLEPYTVFQPERVRYRYSLEVCWCDTPYVIMWGWKQRRRCIMKTVDEIRFRTVLLWSLHVNHRFSIGKQIIILLISTFFFRWNS